MLKEDKEIMTDNDKRQSNRIGIVIDIKVVKNDDENAILKSNNLSDTGILLENSSVLSFEVDEVVTLVVHATLGDEPPQPVKAQVVRISAEGVALKFLL